MLKHLTPCLSVLYLLTSLCYLGSNSAVTFGFLKGGQAEEIREDLAYLGEACTQKVCLKGGLQLGFLHFPTLNDKSHLGLCPQRSSLVVGGQMHWAIVMQLLIYPGFLCTPHWITWPVWLADSQNNAFSHNAQLKGGVQNMTCTLHLCYFLPIVYYYP